MQEARAVRHRLVAACVLLVLAGATIGLARAAGKLEGQADLAENEKRFEEAERRREFAGEMGAELAGRLAQLAIGSKLDQEYCARLLAAALQTRDGQSLVRRLIGDLLAAGEQLGGAGAADGLAAYERPGARSHARDIRSAKANGLPKGPQSEAFNRLMLDSFEGSPMEGAVNEFSLALADGGAGDKPLWASTMNEEMGLGTRWQPMRGKRARGWFAARRPI